MSVGPPDFLVVSHLKRIALVKTGLLVVIVLVVISILTVVLNLPRAIAQYAHHPQAEKYQLVADLLDKAIVSDDGTPEEQRSRLVEAISKGISELPEHSYVARELSSLRESLQMSGLSSTEQGRVVQRIRQIGENLRFRPIAEAKMPEGFPACTPVGEVEVKQYPPYRVAVTKDGGMAFWRLFAHIKKNNVEMTAPVEMTLSENGDKPVLMGFLYEHSNQGSVGEDGQVTVRDETGGWVVSTGIRGPRNERSLAEARERVQKWLSWHGDRWEVAGPPRLLGYNSPFVPSGQNYWEYQIPVREKRTP